MSTRSKTKKLKIWKKKGDCGPNNVSTCQSSAQKDDGGIWSAFVHNKWSFLLGRPTTSVQINQVKKTLRSQKFKCHTINLNPDDAVKKAMEPHHATFDTFRHGRTRLVTVITRLENQEKKSHFYTRETHLQSFTLSLLFSDIYIQGLFGKHVIFIYNPNLDRRKPQFT